MGKSFEYKFVRLGEYGGSAFFGVHDKVRNAYQEVVHEHARDGWRAGGPTGPALTGRPTLGRSRPAP